MSEKDTTYFRDLETRLHRKEVRNSPEAVSELLSDEFIEFTKLGAVWDKAGTIEGLEGEQEDLEIEIEDFTVRRLAPTVALVTYRSTMLNPDDGTKIPALRSSIWKLEEAKWRMVFHQGTATNGQVAEGV